MATLVLGDPSTGALTYLHQDHLGGIALATDEDGLVVQLYDTHPYGTTLLEEDYDPSSETPYSFTGKEYTEDTGLFYFEARWYDPLIGRFVSGDPISQQNPAKLIMDPQAFNYYAYSRNNPVNYVDPTGTIFEPQWQLLSQDWYNTGNYISAYMLRHSLENNPIGRSWNNNSYVARTIKTSSEYDSLVSQIKTHISEGTLEGDLSSINNGEGFAFESGDLGTSIHGITGLDWEATENEDGTYTVDITMTDTYNFAWDWAPEDKTQLGVNAAWVDQQLGVIESYDIEVSMQETIEAKE